MKNKIIEEYGPNGPGDGVLLERCFEDLNKLLTHKVSFSTFRRALRDLKHERS